MLQECITINEKSHFITKLAVAEIIADQQDTPEGSYFWYGDYVRLNMIPVSSASGGES